eukprot:TRINITY_DN5280_c0_g1_i2.p1 TRINITY_DN5280_c0_g1~~TRINITY_DN5280_c0_g1_i2.p1  ORF type:complete len:202 (-),score=43.60 TRINITY_DN5280_c0_g1_i2:55-660(-)
MEGSKNNTSTEKEKMLNGSLYQPWEPVLVEERARAKKLIYKFNTVEDPSQKREILKELFGHFGENSTIESPLNVDYGYNIHFGKNSFMNYGCVILDCAKVEIGENVLIAPNVQIYTATHPTDPKIRLQGLEMAYPIKIGNNVWIGGGSIILPKVTIGDNTTIGAGSVVTKSIPANVVAAGNPAKIIKHLDVDGDQKQSQKE